MAELDDEYGWIRDSQKGDQDAFAALVRQHQRMIHSLTFRMTGSMSDADDLAQETFIQAFRQLANFRGEARFSSWLYRIAMNLSLNWLDGNRRRRRLYEDYSASVTEAEHSDSGRSQLVQEALMQLKPKQRAAIVLTTYDGLNHAEAARVLGCSETTVSWRLFAARAKLKKILAATREREKAFHDT